MFFIILLEFSEVNQPITKKLINFRKCFSFFSPEFSEVNQPITKFCLITFFTKNCLFMSIHFKKSFSDSSLSYHLPTFIKNIRTFDFRGNCRNKNIWIKGSEPDLLKFSSDFINDNFNNIYFKDNSNSWLNYNDHNYIIFKLFNRKNTLIRGFI